MSFQADYDFTGKLRLYMKTMTFYAETAIFTFQDASPTSNSLHHKRSVREPREDRVQSDT